MSRQTHWVIESPQGLEGMQRLSWQGGHSFFVGLASLPDGEPLWVEVPFDFVRRLVVQFWLEIRLDCGFAGAGLYVTPVSPWVSMGIDERGAVE